MDAVPSAEQRCDIGPAAVERAALGHDAVERNAMLLPQSGNCRHGTGIVIEQQRSFAFQNGPEQGTDLFQILCGLRSVALYALPDALCKPCTAAAVYIAQHEADSVRDGLTGLAARCDKVVGDAAEQGEGIVRAVFGNAEENVSDDADMAACAEDALLVDVVKALLRLRREQLPPFAGDNKHDYSPFGSITRMLTSSGRSPVTVRLSSQKAA